ncbi:MAG: insulinase family protein, partial [Cyanobacteria bacterium]|nr:insulinase family protein [Cyanobacteriota bacterium]MDW8203109.1 pitrilysin family protein [Cyanobacteriota bacterium SKYGB_h_bin112]
MMKRWAIRLLGILASLAIAIGNNSLPAWAAQPLHYTELKFSPLPEIQIPNYIRYQLPNGLVVYLVEDHELPLVQGVALVRTGDRLEPADKVGLASLTGNLIRSGGTMLHKVDELNQLLEDRAASIESGIGTTVGNIRFRCLSADLADVLQLFAEVMQQPAFAPDRLNLLKNQYKGSIARRNDDPDEIASREFYKLIYGSASPYARTIEYADLRRITRDDIVAFHRQYFRPDRVLLGIVG